MPLYAEVFLDLDVQFQRAPLDGRGVERSATLALVRRAWPFTLAPYAEPAGFARNIVAKARVEHGRWVVDCPFGCGGAQLASKTEARFFCVDCLHRGKAEGAWIGVLFPTNMLDIEVELSKRENPLTRNWFPGETLEDLREEAFLHANESKILKAFERIVD